MDEVIKENNIDYDPRFVHIAIENDALDIVFKLRDKYPQSFTKNEGLFLDSIILSFTKSNH